MELSPSPKKDEVSSTCNEISQFQAQLNRIRNQAIIGLEYIIEVQISENFNSVLHCALCEEKLDLTSVIHHLTEYVHRESYLKKHFPTAFKKLSKSKNQERRDDYTEQICKSIEDKYGRNSIMVVRNSEFSKNRMKYFEEALNTNHFDEKMGSSFIELFTETRKVLDSSLSSISDEEISSGKSKRSKVHSLSTISDDENFCAREGASEGGSLFSISDQENMYSAAPKSKFRSSLVWPENNTYRISDLRDVLNAKSNTYYYRQQGNAMPYTFDEFIESENSIRHPGNDLLYGTDLRRSSKRCTCTCPHYENRSKHNSPRKSRSSRKEKKRRRQSISPRKSRSRSCRDQSACQSCDSPYRLSRKINGSRGPCRSTESTYLSTEGPFRSTQSPCQSTRSYGRKSESKCRTSISKSGTSRSKCRTSRSKRQTFRSKSRTSRSRCRTSRGKYRTSRSPCRTSRSPCRTSRSQRRTSKTPYRSSRSPCQMRSSYLPRSPRQTSRNRSQSRRGYRLQSSSSQRSFPALREGHSPVGYFLNKRCNSPATSQSYEKSAFKTPKESRQKDPTSQGSKRLLSFQNSTSDFSSLSKSPNANSPDELSWMDQESDCLAFSPGAENGNAMPSTNGVELIEMRNHAEATSLEATVDTQVSPSYEDIRKAVSARFVKFLTEQGRADELTPTIIKNFTDQYFEKQNSMQNDYNDEQDDVVITLNDESNDFITSSSLDMVNVEVNEEDITEHIIEEVNTVADNLTLSHIPMHTKDEFNVYSSVTSLSDRELNILAKNFTDLSDAEKRKVIERLQIIEKNDPKRFNQLKNDNLHISVLLRK